VTSHPEMPVKPRFNGTNNVIMPGGPGCGSVSARGLDGRSPVDRS
jgi:hypothetical protein